MRRCRTARHEPPPQPPFAKGGLGGFGKWDFLRKGFDVMWNGLFMENV